MSVETGGKPNPLGELFPLLIVGNRQLAGLRECRVRVVLGEGEVFVNLIVVELAEVNLNGGQVVGSLHGVSPFVPVRAVGVVCCNQP